MTLALLLRLVGASLVVLALFHAVLWRSLHWDRELERLSPLTARVFAVHVFFIAFVLFALGMLSLVRPDLLLVHGDLQRLLLGAVVLFWLARLCFQPLVFDRAMTLGWTRTVAIRAGAHLLWASYLVLYAAVFFRQWSP